MPSLWSVSIPAAAAATFAATWVLTPAPRVGVAAPSPAFQAAPLIPASPPALPAIPAARSARRAAPPAHRATLLASRAALPARRMADNVYYPGCNAVRAAGRAPLYRGEPGYRPEMDGDDDGIACEPHRRGW